MINIQDTVSQFNNGRIDLLATQIVEGFITGLHKSPFHGFSAEFVEHRIYNRGESKKHIDWKLYAKTDKLFVKKYEDETNLRCQIIIDTSSSMGFPNAQYNKLHFSVLSAAALIQLLQKQRDAFGLTLFDKEVWFNSPAYLKDSHKKRLMHQLEQLINRPLPQKVANFSTAKILHQIAEQLPKRSLVILFSDMFSQEPLEDLTAALQHLRFKQHEVVLFHVGLPEQEQQLEYPHQPIRFVDTETGESIKINPAEIQKGFQEVMSNYCTELKNKCIQNKIDFVEVDINKPYNEVLRAFLQRRQIMF